MHTPDADLTTDLAARVAYAHDGAKPLCIHGGATKAFYGRQPLGEPLDVAGHRGVVAYEPTELVITARAGTPLVELEATLAAEGQMLPFEPPRFGAASTLGGTIACNLSGPRRPYAGAARDFVLGTRILDGRGQVLRFGGQVMKNVAGYDVSRLMAGALGTLGVLLEVSLKVLPRPQAELTLVQEADAAHAVARLHDWSCLPLPISASLADGERLWLRLSGTLGAVSETKAKLGGEEVPPAQAPWRAIRDHDHPFFHREGTLWRLSVASDAPPMDLPGAWLYDWGGAQRWLFSQATPGRIREIAREAGGHATRFRGGERDLSFAPLEAGIMEIHQALKRAFDPRGILNPGRMYAES